MRCVSRSRTQNRCAVVISADARWRDLARYGRSQIGAIVLGMRTVSHSEFGRLFRAKVKVSSREKWLILSFEWKFILEVKSGGLHLHGLPARVDSVRSTLLAFGAGIPTILVLLWTWGYLNSYLLSISSDGTVLIAAVS